MSVGSESEGSASSCSECRRSQQQLRGGQECSVSSSSSDSISIHFTSRLQQIRQQSGVQLLQDQLAQLTEENEHLRAQNSRLLVQIGQGSPKHPHEHSKEKELRRKLKAKSREVTELKTRLSQVDLVQFAGSKISQVQERQYRLPRRRDKRQGHAREDGWREGERRRVAVELESLRGQLEALEVQCQWMGRLCVRLVGMAEKLSGLFGERVIERGWSLKRQSKVAWQYVKHVVGYLLAPDGRG